MLTLYYAFRGASRQRGIFQNQLNNSTNFLGELLNLNATGGRYQC